MSTIDILVFVISIIGIFLEMFQKSIFWLTYIVASIFAAYEFNTDHLYGSMLLQLIYILTSIFGWYKWSITDKKQQNQVKICHTTLKQWLIYSLTAVIGSFIIYFFLKYMGDDSNISDTILTVMCLIATYMAAFKQIESWFVFVASVLISVPLYLNHHLYFTALTYLIFGILDLIGGIKWVYDYKHQAK